MSTAIVSTYATDLLISEVHAHPDGYRWTRRPGPAAPGPFRVPSTALAAALTGIGSREDVRLLLGEATAWGGRTYHPVGDHQPVVHWLLLGGPEGVPGGAEALETALRGVGALLAEIHRLPARGLLAGSASARPLERLRTWLTGPADEILRAHITGTTARTLLDWCEEALDPRRDHVVSHGAPGLGSLVLEARSGAAGLLVGEDVCLAPWQFDLGWLIGDLVELRWAVGGSRPSRWQRLVDAVTEGYGRDLGDAWHRWAALNIAVHVHDRATYTRDGRRPAELLALLVARLVEEARG